MKFYYQFDESDCGAACLAMLASHFSSRFTITEIREFSGTDKNGTNINGLLIAAKQMGFNANAIKCTDKTKTGLLPTPFIAHINHNSTQHFVVVKSMSTKKVVVFDPAIGKVVFLPSDFLRRWSGYAVFLSPNGETLSNYQKKGVFSRFLPLLRIYKKLLLQVLIISIILIFFGIVSSLYFSYLIDEVIFAKAKSTLTALSIGILIITLLQILLTTIRGYLLVLFSTKVDFTIIFEYFSHVLLLPIKFFDSRKTGEILSRIQDAEKIRGALTDASITAVMDSIMVIVVGSILFFQSRLLFAIVILAVPLSSAIIWICAKPFANEYRKLMKENADVQSFLVEALNGHSTIKALNASNLVFSKYEKIQMKSIWTGYKLCIAKGIRDIFTGLINGWGANIIFWVGSFLILEDKMSLGHLISFNALLSYFLGPLHRLLSLQPNLQEALVAAERLGEIMDLPEEINQQNLLFKPTTIYGEITYSQVSFRYGTRRKTLSNITFSIKPGQWVAFVGKSGCGKTSLIKLLLKFYEPEEGEILLDGHNIKDLDTIYLRSKIGYVPQDIFLFSGTLLENIALHHPSASFENIVEAARLAGAHDFIMNQPDRYNTILSEQGSSLSGGEKQRIALARALLCKPSLIVFDEATSNLDTISEYYIHDTLKSLRETKVTTIIIAHRISTVINCDCIFLMDNGTIIDSGTHQHLSSTNHLYAELAVKGSL